MSATNIASTNSATTTGHGPRLAYETFKETVPDIYSAMIALSGKASGDLDKGLLELVKLRASQINGCAFCLQMHLTMARAAKVPAAKLDLIAAWHDAGVYSTREMAALAWTELLTRLAGNSIADSDYEAIRQHFTEKEVAQLTTVIGVINVWNRISTSFAFAPQIPAA